MPSYFSILKTALRARTQISFTGQEWVLQDSLEVLFGQGKLLFGSSRLFHSTITNFNALSRPGTIFAVRSDSRVKRGRNLTVAGALSRTISIPSVSGPSFQVCGYHIDCFVSNPSPGLVGGGFQKAPLATCSSRSFLSNLFVYNLACGRFKAPPNYDVTFCISSSFYRFKKATVSLRDEGKHYNYLVCRHFTYSLNKGGLDSESCLGSDGNDYHSTSSTSVSAGTARDLSVDTSACEEQCAGSVASSEKKIPVDGILKLVSGSCYLPHPDKEETGGEDAHFVCDDELAIGVADGVGGWADQGVDAGVFARELMSNSVNAIQQEPKGFVDPARVLEKAHLGSSARGSSTACIIALTDKGLHAVNLGDSGFIVVRDGCTIFRSPVQQHDFNFTYQLESGNSGDLPSSGQVFLVPVAPGDIIIAGTDGLFDNLYNNEVTAMVVHATRAGLGPQVAAQKIAALAQQHAQDKNRQTPFSSAAQEAGFRYYGGKLDDITVVVSYITRSATESVSSCG